MTSVNRSPIEAVTGVGLVHGWLRGEVTYALKRAGRAYSRDDPASRLHDLVDREMPGRWKRYRQFVEGDAQMQAL